MRAAESDEPEAGPGRQDFVAAAKAGRPGRRFGAAGWRRNATAPVPYLDGIHGGRGRIYSEASGTAAGTLEKELAREEAALRAIRKEVGHRFHQAVSIVSLIIQQFRLELKSLRKISREAERRAGARHAAFRW